MRASASSFRLLCLVSTSCFQYAEQGQQGYTCCILACRSETACAFVALLVGGCHQNCRATPPGTFYMHKQTLRYTNQPLLHVFTFPQAEVQSVRTDGQVQLHVRDAVASKLPPGMLVALPSTLVQPQRKHMHQCGSSGEGSKVLSGCLHHMRRPAARSSLLSDQSGLSRFSCVP